MVVRGYSVCDCGFCAIAVSVRLHSVCDCSASVSVRMRAMCVGTWACACMRGRIRALRSGAGGCHLDLRPHVAVQHRGARQLLERHRALPALEAVLEARERALLGLLCRGLRKSRAEQV